MEGWFGRPLVSIKKSYFFKEVVVHTLERGLFNWKLKFFGSLLRVKIN
jgi:hypothetical protein